MTERFYIIAEGIGYGHIARMTPLYKSLEKKGNVTLFTYGDGVTLAKERNLEVVDLKFSFILKNDSNGLDIQKNAVEYIKRIKFNELAKLSSRMQKEKPKAIFVDSSIVGLMAAKLYGKCPVYFITNNNDLSIFTNTRILGKGAETLSALTSVAPDHVFVADFPPPYSISEPNMVYFGHPEKYTYVGPLARTIPSKKYLHVLVALGGTDNTKALSLLAQTKGEFFSTLKGKNLKTISKDDYPSYFANANVIISHGGHSTIMEALLCGKPLVVLYDGNYAERANNAKQIAALGLGVAVDMQFANSLVIEKAIEDATLLRKNVQRFAVFARKFDAVSELMKYV